MRVYSESTGTVWEQGSHSLMADADDCAHRSRFVLRRGRARAPSRALGRPVVIGGRPAAAGSWRRRRARRDAAGFASACRWRRPRYAAPTRVFLDGAFDSLLRRVARRSTRSCDVRAPTSNGCRSTRRSCGLSHAGVRRAAVAESSRAFRTSCAARFRCGVRSWRAPRQWRASRRGWRVRAGVVHVLDGYEARFLSPLKIEMLPELELPMARRAPCAAASAGSDSWRSLTESQLASLAGRAGRDAGPPGRRTRFDGRRRRPLPADPSRNNRSTPPTADRRRDRAMRLRSAPRDSVGLRVRGVFARTITLRVRFADGRIDSRTSPLPEPSALTEVLQTSAGRRSLERIDRPGRSRSRRGAVSCSGLRVRGRTSALLLRVTCHVSACCG